MKIFSNRDSLILVGCGVGQGLILKLFAYVTPEILSGPKHIKIPFIIGGVCGLVYQFNKTKIEK